jgi:hypothetical protein
MTKLDDLRALYEAVKAGTLCAGELCISGEDLALIEAVFPMNDTDELPELVGMAMDGSIDAAHAMMKALLPDALVFSADQDSVGRWYFTLGSIRGDFLSHEGDADPARARLLAIIAAIKDMPE